MPGNRAPPPPPPLDDPANRRQDARVPVDLDVGFPDRPAFRKSYIRNISGGGVFVQTDEAIPIGTTVRLQMAFADRVITCTCTCVWHNKNPSSDFGRGVGFRFVDLSADEARYVHDLVYRAIERDAAGEPGPKR
jgi:uncharacterized protein (TIGR02266 family)